MVIWVKQRALVINPGFQGEEKYSTLENLWWQKWHLPSPSAAGCGDVQASYLVAAPTWHAKAVSYLPSVLALKGQADGGKPREMERVHFNKPVTPNDRDERICAT